MTLEKAIGILTGNTEYTISEFNEAVRLSIEALKHIQNERAVGGFGREVTLPSLTEE